MGTKEFVWTVVALFAFFAFVGLLLHLIRMRCSKCGSKRTWHWVKNDAGGETFCYVIYCRACGHEEETPSLVRTSARMVE